MSTQWKNLIDPDGRGLSKVLDEAHLSLDLKTSDGWVSFQSRRILTEAEVAELRSRLAPALPAVRHLTISITYPSLADDVRRDPKLAVTPLRARMRAQHRAASHFVDWNDLAWDESGSKLLIGVTSPDGVRYLNDMDMPLRCAEWMKYLFGIPCQVAFRVTADETVRLRQIAEQRAREEEALAQITVSTQTETTAPAADSGALIGQPIREQPLPMNRITQDIGHCTVRGEVSRFTAKEAKNGKTRIVTFSLSDHLGSVDCKFFVGSRRGADNSQKGIEQQMEKLTEALKDGKWVTASGSYGYDDFNREMMLMIKDLEPAEKPVRRDTAPKKRVELHLHTSFSTMDACASPTDLIKQAAAWGHPAIAITDHGVVQSFPEAFGAAAKAGIKLIPGCEGYLIDDDASIIKGDCSLAFDDAAYVVLDVETTGLNQRADEIIEIGAVRFEHGEEVGEFSQLIKPERPLPEKITEITGITQAMLADQPSLSDVMPAFAQFCKGAVLCAHNADFDMSFMRRAFRSIGEPFDFVTLDTLPLSQNQYPHLRNHKLGSLCKHLGVSLTNAHRAVHDARATALVLMKMLSEVASERHISNLSELNGAFGTDAGKRAYHIVLLAASQTGMTNLYRLISEAHLHYYHRTPRMPRSLIARYREGLIIGSACEAGELFQAVLDGAEDEALEHIARFYDYLEIQPIGNNAFLIDDGTVADEEGLRNLNRKIIELGERLHLPVCATGDVHFKEPTDAIFRSILMDTKGFEDADRQPPLYFRTTDDMLREFSYLGREKAEEVVVDNPRRIAEQIGDVKIFIPHPEGKETFQPFWPEAEDELRGLVLGKAASIFGDPLPEIVQKRLDKELGAIIGYGFSTLYMIAVKLVAKSLSDGYIVGSRGSVGSSLVAHFSGITEVDPLPPHYVCPKCKHYEFDVPREYTTGLDLPPKKCPECGADMDKDGFNIPFEVFLGFHGDKVPDIDLNFSGEYQPRAHNYIKELFGEEYCFRAGTIGTIAEKTAYGYVLKYAEKRGLALSNAEKERLAMGITGVKRTTGQHPAGMVVLPKEYEIYQFTPIQHPADDPNTETITTHFDFGSMHDVLVKLDVLGHDDPTMLRKLQDITGIAPQQVPLHDPEVFGRILSLFSSPEALGLTAEQLQISESGTLGVPEFGTPFVRGMLKVTQPTTMEELVRISGLSHGTDVWLGNAYDLVLQNVPLRECICTRDDIMNQLMSYGVEPSIAFKTMESVRKGRGLKPEMEQAIASVDAPAWFMDSCKKIKYMFPKAHAVAYVTMALRIAYFKIFYPTAYYCCYLARNAESFDATRMVDGDVDAMVERVRYLRGLSKEEQTAKTDDEATILESLVEMNLRGIHLRPIDIYRSSATEFTILDENTILPPINSLPGIGSSAAEAFVASREAGPFISVDDMLRRKVPKGVIETLRNGGCINDIPETSQVTLFDFGV